MAIRPDPCLYRRRPTNALKESLRQRSATSTRQMIRVGNFVAILQAKARRLLAEGHAA